ncbi:ladinin-1 isoform X2 [Brachyhypopomus gauderio]
MDFVEMLRMRDERRRRRQMETLDRQRKEEEGEGDEAREEGESTGEVWVGLQGDTQQDDLSMSMQCCSETHVSPPPVSPTDFTLSQVSENGKHRGNGSTNNDHNVTPLTAKERSQKFVSSVSISFEKSPTSPGVASSPSPTSPSSQAPGVNNILTSAQNGEQKGCQNESGSSSEPADKPPFIRQSSRTRSFRILKKKEEENMSLQRSASMRIATKKFEPNKGSNEDEGQQSPFQRNTRQRVSSRSIQEKMERLAQASQKWEAIKSPTLAHKTMFLVDEVSKKRELFEKEQGISESLTPNKEDYRSLSAGISDRINRWVKKKSLHSLSSLTPTDLRHVDISSKKMLFERGQEEGHQTTK